MNVSPFNTNLAGEWVLNGTPVTGVIPISSLSAATNPQILEFEPSGDGCVVNATLQFNVSQAIGAVQIFGDTALINNQLYCPGDAIMLSVPNLDACQSCEFFFENGLNNVFEPSATNSGAFLVEDNDNISAVSYTHLTLPTKRIV